MPNPEIIGSNPEQIPNVVNILRQAIDRYIPLEEVDMELLGEAKVSEFIPKREHSRTVETRKTNEITRRSLTVYSLSNNGGFVSGTDADDFFIELGYTRDHIHSRGSGFFNKDRKALVDVGLLLHDRKGKGATGAYAIDPRNFDLALSSDVISDPQTLNSTLHQRLRGDQPKEFVSQPKLSPAALEAITSAFFEDGPRYRDGVDLNVLLGGDMKAMLETLAILKRRGLAEINPEISGDAIPPRVALTSDGVEFLGRIAS